MTEFNIVRTYRAMTDVVSAVIAGQLNFVVIIGDPGIGKTNTFRRQLGEDALIVQCTTQPFGLYTELYANRQKRLIALDDTDTLDRTPAGVSLLKALGQTDPEKTLSWTTKAADREGIPRQFTMRCRIMMFCNTVSDRNLNMQAVLDRAHCFRFMPTPEEVHEQVRTWIDRKETETKIEHDVFEFIGGNLAKITKPTFRDYVKASELHSAKLDWKTSLMNRWTADPALTAAAEIVRLSLAGDPNLATADQRAQRFHQWGHGTRSTFMLKQQQVFELYGWKRMPKANRRVQPRTILPPAMVVNSPAIPVNSINIFDSESP